MGGLTGLQARKNRRNPSSFRRELEVSVPGLGSLRNEKEELHTFKHRHRSRRPARSCSSVEVLSEISPLVLLQLLWRASAFLLVAYLQAILSSESGPLSPAV